MARRQINISRGWRPFHTRWRGADQRARGGRHMAKVKAKQDVAAPPQPVTETAGGIKVPRNIQREDDMLAMWLALIARPAGTLCGLRTETGVRFYAIELNIAGGASLRDVTAEVEPIILAQMQADRQARARGDRDLRRL